jgi:hypothetical protein
MVREPIFRISFLQQGQVYEVYARHVSQGGILGFVEVEEVLFGERSQVVVDPSEERLRRLRTEFEGVRRFYLPLHSVLRIDEVERQGAARIRKVDKESDRVTPFPLAYYPPRGSDSGKN